MIEEKVRGFGTNKDQHYKYWIYVQLNPELKPSPFLSRIDRVGKSITKFRLGSHSIKIETGRWNRTPRENRLCDACGVLEDEFHVVYTCTKIQRNDLQLPQPLSALWDHEHVNQLFKRLVDAEYLTWKGVVAAELCEVVVICLFLAKDEPYFIGVFGLFEWLLFPYVDFDFNSFIILVSKSFMVYTLWIYQFV